MSEKELTQDQIVETLKGAGITNLSELAEKTLANAREKNHPVEPQYLVTGPGYFLHHAD